VKDLWHHEIFPLFCSGRRGDVFSFRRPPSVVGEPNRRSQDGDADSLSALCSKKQAQRHEKALGISLAPSNDGSQPMPNSNCWRG
jgi:hypothetical protein